MKKEEDIFKFFNEMDELIDSVNSQNSEETTTKNNDIQNIPEMPKVYFDKELKTNIYMEEKIEEPKEKINVEIEEKVELKEEQIIEEKQEENIPKKEKKKKRKKGKKWVITFAILDVLAITCIFLMYGPISYFRNLWVTSAMTTMSHKYLAYIFFNDAQVKEIMSNNTVIEVDGNTNKDEIQILPPDENQNNGDNIIEYTSKEEEQILKRDEGNDLYKVIDVQGSGYKGHLLVVYDPSKVKLKQITNMKYGQMLNQFVQRNNAVAGINAGGFSYSKRYGYSPSGVVIIDGQIVADNGSTGWGGGIIGFTNDNVLVLTKSSAQEAVSMGIRDAVSFGPFLIVNGVSSQFKGNGGYGIAPRTAIGQRKDGIVLMLVIDGRRPGHSLGVDMVELTNIMKKYGAYNAANLDGGGSSSMAVGNKIINVAGGSGYSGDRYLLNSWLVMQ